MQHTGTRIRRCTPAIIITLVLFVISLIVPPVARAQDDAATTSLPAEAQEIVHAINRIRLANGLNSLRAHALLNQAAQNHVNDLIANGIYGHYGSDGSNLRTRISRTGYPSLWVSENWVTAQNVEGAMNWWMNDWIHRVNILDASWDEVGVGVGQVSNGWWIFVTDFANADGKDTSVTVEPLQAAAEQPALGSIVPAGGTEYTVQSGDTLMAIGVRFGVEWQDIAIANDLGEFDILNIGRTLHIPSIATSESAAVDVPEGGLEYTVLAGDTLSGIASRYKIDWQDIAAANKLGEYSVLQIGMQIRLPGVPEATSTNSTASASATPAAAHTEASGGFVGDAGGVSYTVKSGDTLYTIAARNAVSWTELARVNGLSEQSFLQIGQEIVIPSTQATTSAAVTSQTTRFANGTAISSANTLLPTPTPTLVITTQLLNSTSPTPAPTVATSADGTYTVKAGDTVIAIAVRLGVGWKELLDANGLSDNSILSLGQVLIVP